MRKLLNSLYILQEDVFLKLDGLNIVATRTGTEIFRVPFCNIENIVCFNYIGCSPALMGKCAEENVSLCFLRPSGKFLARIVGPIKGNVLLRLEQFQKLQNPEFCLTLSKAIINAKIINSRNFLMKHKRENAYIKFELDYCIDILKNNLCLLEHSKNLDAVRGVEGESAKQYFNVFNHLITSNRQNFVFNARTRRPPLDRVNAMLSYLYTLLSLDCVSALETVGLDPYIGFLHTERPGRASLALDLMEEMRQFFVDRLVVKLINKVMISPEDFVIKESGAVEMTEEGKKKILTEWQKNKREIITHKVISEKIEIGLLPYIQARLLAKFLRGESEGYEPFTFK